MKQKLKIFDTTLRDGAQTIGINMSLQDKKQVASLLSELGVGYIEAGFPGANAIDDELFQSLPDLGNSKLTAFGMMARAGRSVENDETLAAVVNSNAETYCLVGKAWDWHVEDALKINVDQHLQTIAETVSYAAQKGEVIFDAEHFFDGYKANPEFSMRVLRAAIDNGASTFVMCDTNGGTMPDEIFDIVGQVKDRASLNSDQLGIHTHNDCGFAEANTYMAVKAGVGMIQGTLGGIGERCGNANLLTLLPTLVLKQGYDCGDVTADRLGNITELYKQFCQIIGIEANPSKPYVGEIVFSTKAGLHASAQATNVAMYEHLNPKYVGGKRSVRVSNQSGFSNIRSAFAEMGVVVTDQNEQAARSVLLRMDELQQAGHAFDMAPQSFEMFVREQLFQDLDLKFFNVMDWKVSAQRYNNSAGEKRVVSEATVKLSFNHESSKTHHEVNEGNGPVNALDNAIRKTLLREYPFLENFTLSKYNVGLPKHSDTTAAQTRVNIMMTDTDVPPHECHVYGLSSNVVDASMQALLQAYRWRIMKETEPVQNHGCRPLMT